MTTMTLAPAFDAFPGDPLYAQGRADAYDDETAGLTLDQLSARAVQYAEHAPISAAFGYTDRVLEIRAEHAARTAAETHVAYIHHIPAGAR
jgi:hypothetical protein